MSEVNWMGGVLWKRGRVRLLFERSSLVFGNPNLANDGPWLIQQIKVVNFHLQIR